MHDYELQLRVVNELTVFIQLISVATIVLSFLVFIVWVHYKYKKSGFSKLLKKLGKNLFYCGLTFLGISTMGIILGLSTKRLTYPEYISIIKDILEIFF